MYRSTSDHARVPRVRRTPIALTSLMVLALCGAFVASSALGAPSSATDESKVPHYFGPYPNWANSPLTKADATVKITGDGTGATAGATVGANGAINGLTITNAGS